MERTIEGQILTDIILQVFKLSGLLIAEGDILTEELGLSSARWKVLGAISHTRRPITVSEIARNMGLSRQAVQRLSNEMLKDNLLYAQQNPEHKRAKLFALTSKGETAFEALDKKQTAWINTIAKSLIAEGTISKDLTLTLSCLEKVANQFNQKHNA